MSKFDDIFSRKAKEAFDNYNADHLAGDGWNSFTSKYGRKRRRALVIPLWARAASIAVLITAGVLFIYHFSHRQPGEQVDQATQLSHIEKTDSTLIKEDTASVAPANKSTDQAPGPLISIALSTRQSGREEKSNRAGEQVGPHLTEGARSDITESPGSVPTVGTHVADASSTDEKVRAGTFIADEVASGVVLDVNPSVIRLTDDADARLNLKPKSKPMDYLVLPRQKMTTTLMTGLSGMMASIDNAKSTAQGVSIGFYVERQLTRSISVRPGLAMAKHSYGMEGAPGSIMSGGNMALDYAAPELNGLSGTTASYEADIDIVSMEVPVNFVFSVRKRAGTNLFLATGASTVFYLSQHMSGNFNNTYTRTTMDSYGEVSSETMTTTVQVESENELLNRVDFMGLANFSAGYSFPFGKGTHLLFEPFIQLPLKDLTSQNLRIRYGGLSMKIQF